MVPVMAVMTMMPVMPMVAVMTMVSMVAVVIVIVFIKTEDDCRQGAGIPAGLLHDEPATAVHPVHLAVGLGCLSSARSQNTDERHGADGGQKLYLSGEHLFLRC
jgi:hypothetical protein